MAAGGMVGVIGQWARIREVRGTGLTPSLPRQSKNFGPPQINKCMVNSGRPTSFCSERTEYCLCLSNLL